VVKDRLPRPGEKLDPGAPREEEGVFVLEHGRARFRPVQAGLIGDLTVEVVSGLQGGESLIVGPFKALRELKGGEAVRAEKRKREE
jgi:HlyD family secretion protein